jgi:hypothetical protein
MSIGQPSLFPCYPVTNIYMQKSSNLHIISNTMQTTTPEVTKVATSNVNQESTSHIDQQENQSNKQVSDHRNGIYY